MACGICYERIQDLPHHMFCCQGSHTLHTACLLKWLAHQHVEGGDITCPFCRKVLLTPDEFLRLYDTECACATDAPSPHHVLVNYPEAAFDNLRFMRITYQSHFCMILNIFLLLVLLVTTKQ